MASGRGFGTIRSSSRAGCSFQSGTVVEASEVTGFVDDNKLPVRIAAVVPCTQAEGPGHRFAVWVQGCPLRCADCCNPEMLFFDGGTLTSVGDLLGQIFDAQSAHNIEGITLIGGEPFAHAEPLARVAEAVKQAGLSVMVFSGFTVEELHAKRDPPTNRLLATTDLLVDGPYDRNRPDTTRRWIGSTNQRVHFLSDRYSPDDAFWNQSDTLEIRLEGTDVLINGFPAGQAASLWKRLSPK